MDIFLMILRERYRASGITEFSDPSGLEAGVGEERGGLVWVYGNWVLSVY